MGAGGDDAARVGPFAHKDVAPKDDEFKGSRNASVGVLGPVVLTATDSPYLHTVATQTGAFEPVPTTCRTAPSPPDPQQHTVLDISVVTCRGAKVSVLYRFKAGAATQSHPAGATGRADVLPNIGGATVAFPVPVTVTVTLATNTSSRTTASPRGSDRLGPSARRGPVEDGPGARPRRGPLVARARLGAE